MYAGKVISIEQVRRRVARAHKRRSARNPQGFWQGTVDWLSSKTTRGTAILAGITAGLVFGALVASVMLIVLQMKGVGTSISLGP